jgi:hypothetical protein
MSIRACLCFLAFAAGLGAQPMFEGASGLGEEIKGNPKTVRVERETLGDKASRVIEEKQV